MPRLAFNAMLLAVASCLAAASARADHEPAFVLPDRFGRPVIVDGLDLTGAVIEGDWGLYRPGHGRKVIYDAGVANPTEPPGYFPATGRAPARGRFEIEPRPGMPGPRPAEPYYRQWGMQSGTAPPTILPPYDPPAVIVSPRLESRKRPPLRRPH